MSIFPTCNLGLTYDMNFHRNLIILLSSYASLFYSEFMWGWDSTLLGNIAAKDIAVPCKMACMNNGLFRTYIK